MIKTIRDKATCAARLGLLFVFSVKPDFIYCEIADKTWLTLQYASTRQDCK